MTQNRKVSLKGKTFIVVALGINTVGLVNLELGTVQIAGNVPAAGALLTASLGCLVFSLFRPFKELRETEKEKETGAV